MHYARRQRLGTRLVLIFLKIPGGRVQIDGGMGIHEMPDSDTLERRTTTSIIRIRRRRYVDLV